MDCSWEKNLLQLTELQSIGMIQIWQYIQTQVQQGRIQNPVKHRSWSVFQKSQRLKAKNIRKNRKLIQLNENFLESASFSKIMRKAWVNSQNDELTKNYKLQQIILYVTQENWQTLIQSFMKFEQAVIQRKIEKQSKCACLKCYH